MSYDKDGTTVVVTGAAGGIGAAVARRFAAAGATLVLGDLNAVGLEALAGELAALTPVHAAGVPADCENLMATAAADAGRVDVVVNTAGVWTEGPSERTTEEEWDRVLDVNLKGTFFCCRYAIPHLKKTQGCIINLSSDAGVVGTPETAVYTASKGGVSLLTKSLALELAPDLVRCVAVCPADVMTPMLEGQARDFGGDDPEGYFARLLASYPQRDKARCGAHHGRAHQHRLRHLRRLRLRVRPQPVVRRLRRYHIDSITPRKESVPDNG
jgi:NAD(P)-dependent dehydrogenase (short-subunit alcohol dehydrogenase family)